MIKYNLHYSEVQGDVKSHVAYKRHRMIEKEDINLYTCSNASRCMLKAPYFSKNRHFFFIQERFYFYDRIDTIYQFIISFLDKTKKKSLFLRNMEPL